MFAVTVCCKSFIHKCLDNCSNFAMIGHFTSQTGERIVQMLVGEFKAIDCLLTSVYRLCLNSCKTYYKKFKNNA